MSLWTKEMPDELKDLNLTPAQIREQLNKAKELEGKVAEQEGRIGGLNTTLETQRTEFEQTKARLSEIEANSRRQPVIENKIERPGFTFPEDEVAFTDRFNEAMKPVAMTALNAARNTAKMSARNSLSGKFMNTTGGSISLGRLWDKWETEINKAAEGVPLINLGNEQTWLNLFNFIKGQHVEEMMSKTSDFIESSGDGTREVIIGSEGKKKDQLTEAELAQAKKMKISPEKFLESKQKMRFFNA